MKIINPLDLLQDWLNKFNRLPPAERYRRGIFYNSIILSVMVLGFTIYLVQAIPENIKNNIKTALVKRPWVNDLIVVDGRNVYLVGESETNSGLENEIDIISRIPGVRSVINRLDEIPKPSPYLKIKKSVAEVELSGELNGETLDQVLSMIESTYNNLSINDQIVIDDRLGRPLWLEGFETGLEKLSTLKNYELNGWQTQLELSGTTDSETSRRQLGYALPASLVREVKVINRLRQNVTDLFPSITLISDWQGVYLGGTVPSEETRQSLLDAVVHNFGEQNFAYDLTVDKKLTNGQTLERLSRLFVHLKLVHDLRLQSTQEGFVVWGRVDNPNSLGEFLYARNETGLSEQVRSEIVVSAADRPASLSLFSDQIQVIVSGILPTVQAREQLLRQTKIGLGISSITDLTSIEPNVAHSRWMDRWSDLLDIIPDSTFGISVNDKSVLLTGTMQSEDAINDADIQLERLFPDLKKLNWITANN